MAVPSSLIDRLNRLEEKRRRVTEAHARDHVVQAARRAAQDKLRAGRDTYLALAGDIFDWRNEATRSREGQRVWALLGGARVMLYAGWYWDGLPIEKRNALQAQTRISLDGPDHRFLIEEWRSDAVFREIGRPTSPLMLLEMLHPDQIMELQTCLSGSDGWQQIINELDRRLEGNTTHGREEHR